MKVVASLHIQMVCDLLENASSDNFFSPCILVLVYLQMILFLFVIFIYLFIAHKCMILHLTSTTNLNYMYSEYTFELCLHVLFKSV